MATKNAVDRLLHITPMEQTARKAESLVKFLNGQANGAEHWRMMETFKLCRQFETLNPNTPIAGNVRRAINALVEEFMAVPILRVKWEWKPAHPSLKATSAEAVLALTGLMHIQTIGMLDRIRQCICGNWFFAASNKKAVCGDNCRSQKFKDSRPSFRAERAEYMRGYRKNPAVKKLQKGRRKA